MNPLALFACLTVSVSLLSTLPQVLRVARTRNVEGLSPASVMLTLVVFTLWSVYGVGILDCAQIVNNVGGGALFLLLAHFVAVETGALRRWHGLVAVLLTAALAVAVAALTTPTTAAAIGTFVGLFTRVPQMRVALTGGPLWGLDPWAVLLGLLTPLLWVVYGVAVSDTVVIISSLIGACLQSVIVWRRLPVRRTLDSLAGGRLGGSVAALLAPVSARFPYALD